MAEPTRLSPEQERALARLSRRRELGDFYLAGGSAIALALGHRRSLDLDFFSLRSDVDLEPVARAAAESFERCEVVSRSDAALQLVCDGARLDFVRYPYALLDPPAASGHGPVVAGLRDLGVMKLAAIARRGLHRDFWDLFEILHAGAYDLAALGAAYRQKFGLRENDLYHVLKALTYFADAERDPALPAGLTLEKWAEIKRYFERAAPRLLAAEVRGKPPP
ncbi:MAG: nucleotidyl transferase AbiEii/AbiGii toxin family protein [Myxococcales bacterium]|nr:nucleotidyl transferase AbiEii/AbiGii toxin family protein [Myxococcales bacterium]